jgi:NAD(P)-dependent dehydrogenase (short-subunit alcohol dehydrogenase family)
MTEASVRPNRQEVVVVTGASAGLGRAIVREFARHGANVGLIARDGVRLDSTAQDVTGLGGRALPVAADVANAQAVDQAADQIERELGPVDIWVNNAMTTVFAPFEEVTPAEYQRATEVIYLGTVWGTMAALKRMKPRDRGCIVQVGSALAYRSIPLQAPYCGAKHAIKGFTDTIRCELIHDRSAVHITMVQMPALNTPQFDWCRSRLTHHAQPVPPIYNPEIGARAVYWAAHHRRREVQVGISAFASILGQKIAPGLLDLYLGLTGYQSQQTREPIEPGRPDNLFVPVSGNYAAHGGFDKRAAHRSAALWLVTHRPLAVGATLLVISFGFSVIRSLRHG